MNAREFNSALAEYYFAKMEIERVDAMKDEARTLLQAHDKAMDAMILTARGRIRRVGEEAVSEAATSMHSMTRRLIAAYRDALVREVARLEAILRADS